MKLKSIIGLAILFVLICTLFSCADKTKVEEYRDEGYKITVTYDANGGNFFGRDGVSIIDMFNPSDYTEDSNGTVHIKLTEPTDPGRPTSGSDPITLVKTSHFFCGWYQTRTVVTNSDGVIVDENGKEIEEKNGQFVYLGTNKTATPAYTYSGYWDFENDTVDYSEEDGEKELRLYAGWVPYYEFDYYVRENGEWVKYASSNFDYKTTNQEGSKTFDKDTIWTPEWGDCKIVYSHAYNNNSVYNFPKKDGKSFVSAYLDKECTQRIDGEFTHEGTLDLEHGVAVNRVQNIYVVFEEGERYKISTAEQLSNNANPNGYYEILNDLDFTDVKWPASFSTGTFKGKLYTEGGKSVTIKNVSVKHSSQTALAGGMFGTVSDNAVIENISFENVVFDLSYAGTRLKNTSFGIFAGKIEENAKINNVTVSGEMKIGAITLGDNPSINLLANGKISNIEKGELHLSVYGDFNSVTKVYGYKVDPEKVIVDENDNVTLHFVTNLTRTDSSYIIK